MCVYAIIPLVDDDMFIDGSVRGKGRKKERGVGAVMGEAVKGEA